MRPLDCLVYFQAFFRVATVCCRSSCFRISACDAVLACVACIDGLGVAPSANHSCCACGSRDLGESLSRSFAVRLAASDMLQYFLLHIAVWVLHDPRYRRRAAYGSSCFSVLYARCHPCRVMTVDPASCGCLPRCFGDVVYGFQRFSRGPVRVD